MSQASDTILPFCAACGVAAPELFLARMEELRLLLVEENAKTNLTRITSEEDFLNKHVADSVSLALALPEVASEPLAVGDLGCGAGFPSLVLALAFPRLRLTAIDSNHKKTDFVGLAVHKLGIANCGVLRGRGRELARSEKLRGTFDLLVSRAVGSPAEIFREGRQLVTQSGQLVVYRSGGEVDAELAEVAVASTKYGFEWRATSVLQLPLGGERRFVVGSSRL